MPETPYSNKRLDLLLRETFEKATSLRTLKGGEYAGDEDALANFRRNAKSLGVTPETVWAVYAGKHWDAVQQYCKDLESGKERIRSESISGRADDLIVYLILFKALVEVREEGDGKAAAGPGPLSALTGGSTTVAPRRELPECGHGHVVRTDGNRFRGTCAYCGERVARTTESHLWELETARG